MKHLLISLTTLACMTSLAFAANEKAAPTDPKMQEMMKKYQEASTPNDNHKVLNEMAGNWKITTQSWQSPDAKPETNKGTANLKVILGGRWLQQDVKGNMMGKPYQGMGLVGYDNVKQKYETIWVDSMSTGVMQGEGSFDQASKTLKDEGTMSCPFSASKTQDVRNEWKVEGKNKMTYSMYGKGPDAKGPEFKMMEVTYTR